MPRSRRPLAAASALAAAAASGLLIAAAGAAPAYASTSPAPRSHTVTITAHPTAKAKAKAKAACAAKRPATHTFGCAGQTLTAQNITCSITVSAPFVFNQTAEAYSTATCNAAVPGIRLYEALTIPESPFSLLGQDFETNTSHTFRQLNQGCQPGQYGNSAEAIIDLPAGYSVPGGGLAEVDGFSGGIALGCPPPPSPPSGGGGPVACAVRAPAVSARPAVIRPHLHAC